MSANVKIVLDSDPTVSLESPGAMDFGDLARGGASTKVRGRYVSQIAPGGDTLANLTLGFLAVGAVPTEYDGDGNPTVDEMQGRIEVVGIDSSGTPGQEIALTGPQAVGAGRIAELPPIAPGNSLIVDHWIEQPSASAVGAGLVYVGFPLGGDETAFPVPQALTDAIRGIAQGLGGSRSFLVSGGELSESGTPDALINRAAAAWVEAGVPYSDASARSATLDQNDGAAAALASGEEYWAEISQGTSLTAFVVTKGAKAAAGTAVKPAVPTSKRHLGFVRVSYQSGGTSIITTADIVQDLTYWRFKVAYPATGLSAVVHAGEALSDGFMQRRLSKTTITLAPSVDNNVFVDTDGTLTVQTGTDLPTPGAHWIATLTTDTTSVTDFADHRTFIGVTLPSIAPADFIVGGSLELSGLSESQISNLVADLAALVRKDGTIAFTDDQSMGGHKLTDVADPVADTDADTQGARNAAIPKPYTDIYSGDDVTNPLVLTKTPIFGTGKMADRTTTYNYAGPHVERATTGGLLPKLPGASGDADHYQFLDPSGAPKECTLGTILATGEVCKIDYFTLE